MNKGRVVLATTNQGKVAEVADALARFGLEVRGLDAYPQIGEIDENGATFEENALIKARAAAACTGLPAIADDSGLMVDILAGAPGVHSARYGSDLAYLPGESRDARNIRKLLAAMAGVAPERRGCMFVTVMAWVKPDGQYITARGQWHGRILERPIGANGFGYDPVFLDPDLGLSAAQLSREQKNARSHRGAALRSLLAQAPGFLAAQ